MAYFSNGTEGHLYKERYCNFCIHQNAEYGCPIWMLHLAWNYDQHKDDEIAGVLQILIPRDGVINHECSMFVKKGDM